MLIDGIAEYFPALGAYAHVRAANYIDVMEYGYFTGVGTLNYVLAWCETEYPKLAGQVTPDDACWVAKVKASAEATKQKIAKDGDVSQDNLERKLGQYLKKYPRYPEPENTRRVNKLLTDVGHCEGFGYLKVKSSYEGTRERDKKVFKILALWDERSELDKQAQDDIFEVLDVIYNAQHASECQIPQGDWSKYDSQMAIEENASFIMLSLDKVSAVNVFDKILPSSLKEMKQVATHEEKASSKDESCKESIRICANGHVSCVLQGLEFYDPNSIGDYIPYSNIDILSKLVRAAHPFLPKQAKHFEKHKIAFPAGNLMLRLFGPQRNVRQLKLLDVYSQDVINKEAGIITYGAIKIDHKELFNEFSMQCASTALGGYTQLHYTAIYNRVDMAAELLAKHSYLNVVTANANRTALHLAAQYGYLDFVKLLLSTHGVNIAEKMKGRKAGWTALHVAAGKGHVGVVEAILAHSPQSHEALTSDHDSALQIAAMNRRVGVVQVLAKVAGADLNRLDSQGLAPLHYALKWGDSELAILLVSLGAKPFVQARLSQGPRSPSPFELAASSIDNRKLAREMLLHIMRHRCEDDMLRLFMLNPDIVTPFENNDRFIFMAARLDHVGMIDAIALLGVNMNVASPDGKTALHRAAEANCIDAAAALLKHGASVGVEMVNGCRAIHLAKTNEMRQLIMEAQVKRYQESCRNKRYLFWNRERYVVAECARKVAQGLEMTFALDPYQAKIARPQHQELRQLCVDARDVARNRVR